MFQTRDSASDGAVVTPSDTNDNTFRKLLVLGAGNVTLITDKGNSLLLTGVPAGTLLPIATRKVMATGTTATNIVGLT